MKTMYDKIKEMSFDEMRDFIYWVYLNGHDDGKNGYEDSPVCSYFGGAMLSKSADEVMTTMEEFYNK